MTVWAQIDELKVKHEAAMGELVSLAKNQLEPRATVKCDAFGYYVVNFKRRGELKQLRARSPDGLKGLIAKEVVDAKKAANAWGGDAA